MDYAIVTGTSQGIGAAIAGNLLDLGFHVFSVSRKPNPDLLNSAGSDRLSHYPFDLKEIDKIPSLLKNIMSEIDLSSAESFGLINNAGVLSPINFIEHCPAQDIDSNITLNLTVPVILCSQFIDVTASLDLTKRIINVSSGAGKHSINGWSVYGAAKAGLDHFTRIVAKEGKYQKNNIKILSFSPGKVDTPMQAEIRATPVSAFPLARKFIDYKNNGELLDPRYIAEKVTGLLTQKDFPNGGILDISELA